MSHSRVLSPFKGAEHVHDECLTAALNAAESVCVRRGLRLTPLRRRVLELVWRSHEPVKAYDVLDQLRGEHRGAAPPTVYRALDFLQQQGFVHKIESLNAFLGCGEPRARHQSQFLICRGCGEAAELADEDISRLLREKAGAVGFRIDDQTIEIMGCCAECAQRGEA